MSSISVMFKNLYGGRKMINITHDSTKAAIIKELAKELAKESTKELTNEIARTHVNQILELFRVRSNKLKQVSFLLYFRATR